MLDILKKYGFLCCPVICATVLSFSSWDRLLTIRYFIWSLFTIGLFSLIVINNDFGALRSPAIWIFSGYILAVLFSGLFAVNKSEWLYGLVKAFTALVFLFIAITLIDDKIYSVILYLAAGLSLYGLIRILTGHINGMGGNQNQWAHLLVLLVPFCWKYKLVVLLLLLNILFTQNRAAFVAVAVMLFILLDRKMKYALTGFAILILSYFFILGRGSLVSPERMGVWKATLAMFSDYPFGVGSENWKLIIPQYKQYFFESFAFETYVYTRPHNDYLWILSETGVIGLGFYLGFFAYLIKKAWNNKILLSGIAAYMIFAFFSFPMERSIITIMLILLAGLILKDIYKPLKFKLWPVALCVLVFASGIFWMRYIGGCQAKEVRISKDISNMNISWFATIDDSSTPLYLFRGLKKYEINDMNGALCDFKLACKANPNHHYSLVAAAQTLINMNRKEEAVPYLEKYTKLLNKQELK